MLVTPGRLRLGDVLLLIGPGNAQVSGVRQVSAALAVSPREVIDRLVSPAPAHRGARRPWLLARLPLPLRPLRGAPVLPRRRLPPGQVITARRHRRVPRVPRDGPQRRVQLLTQFHGQRCQRRDPLILPRGQLIVQCDPHSQLIDLRRLLTDQRIRGSSAGDWVTARDHPRNHAQPPWQRNARRQTVTLHHPAQQAAGLPECLLQDDYPLCPCFDQVPIELVKFRILSPDAGPLPAAIGVTAAPRRAAASRRPRDPAPAAAAARPLRPTSGPPLPQCLSHREIPPRAPGPRRRGGSSSCPNGRGRGHRTRRAPRPRIRARHQPGPAGSGGDLAEEPRRPPLEDHAQDELSAPAKGRRGPACRQAPPQPAIPGPAPRPPPAPRTARQARARQAPDRVDHAHPARDRQHRPRARPPGRPADHRHRHQHPAPPAPHHRRAHPPGTRPGTRPGTHPAPRPPHPAPPPTHPPGHPASPRRQPPRRRQATPPPAPGQEHHQHHTDHKPAPPLPRSRPAPPPRRRLTPTASTRPPGNRAARTRARQDHRPGPGPGAPRGGAAAALQCAKSRLRPVPGS